MKIQVISDIHLEFHDYEINVLADYLFIAGDLGYPKSAIFQKFISRACEAYKKVFFVPGNHEYYTSNLYDVDKLLRELSSAYHNLIILERNTIHYLEDRKVIGCTLWSVPTKYAYFCMNDKHISHFSREIEINMYEKDKEFISRNVDKNTIVMTHHLPSFKLIDEKYSHYDNSGFASNCDDIIEKAGVWIYGHTHSPRVGMLKDCMCICNPRGYPGENKVYEMSAFDV